jgi:hypothetical protein
VVVIAIVIVVVIAIVIVVVIAIVIVVVIVVVIDIVLAAAVAVVVVAEIATAVENIADLSVAAVGIGAYLRLIAIAEFDFATVLGVVPDFAVNTAATVDDLSVLEVYFGAVVLVEEFVDVMAAVVRVVREEFAAFAVVAIGKLIETVYFAIEVAGVAGYVRVAGEIGV